MIDDLESQTLWLGQIRGRVSEPSHLDAPK